MTFRSGLIGVMAMFWMGVVWAQPVAQPVVQTPGEGVLLLEAGKGTLLRLSEPASTVFVANPEVVDAISQSPRLVYLSARQPGETVIYAVNARDEILYSTVVRVSHDLSLLQDAIARASGDASIRVDSFGRSLILSGTVDSAAQAETIYRLATRFAGEGGVVNQIQVAKPHQVSLQVRIAEVSRETTRALGVDWARTRVGSRFDSEIRFSGALGGAAGATLTGNDLEIMLDALQRENLVTILAEPNLVALSGETANFLAGGEFPIPVPQQNQTVTIEYKRFGISLAFTPTVLDDRVINLRVVPEVSSLSTVGAVQIDGFSIPALTTRRAETTVELRSGQSFAVAGLLRSGFDQESNAVPGLGNLPIIGALFRSEKFRRDETELVVIITPYLVEPVAPSELRLPTEGMPLPLGAERTWWGHTPGLGASSMRPPAGRAAANLSGNAGFVMER